MLPILTVEQESEDDFRTAVVALSTLAGSAAGMYGKLKFLITININAETIVAWDHLLASSVCPDNARAALLCRRNAILPYVGQSLLHGCLTHESLVFDVYVDKALRMVVHWDSFPIND